MKPAPFELVRPASVAEAIAAVIPAGARILAGGQSLGPMLNLRVVQPRLLVQVNHLPELAASTETIEAITLGACVTHATIAAGRLPDFVGGLLANIAGGIAYQAVRNRGTIGGSLSHADPAADWVTVLTALGAQAVLQSAGGTRRVPVSDFIAGAFVTTLAPSEILTAVCIPRPPAKAGWGYVKACRKPGEFAHAMAAALLDGPRRRLVIGAIGGKPLLLTDAQAGMDGARAALAATPGLDKVASHMLLVVVHRALEQAAACRA
ncbi:MAG: FAD binding domain-containing protein [Acetobacteraceae bacterium]|nr:FAD binding domain-containing protein [Acetobacteraceae bacterium]